HHHRFCRRVRRHDRDLRRYETGRQPTPDRRALLDGLTRNQRLQQSADTSTRGTAAALLDRPRASDDADDDIGSGGDAFFGDEEVELARPRLAESGKQSLLRYRVLDEVDVSIEVEAEGSGPDLPHGHDGR